MATRRAKFWRAAAAAFIGINVAGGIYAVVVDEPMHAVVHAVLLILGGAVYTLFRLTPADAEGLPEETAKRLEHLEHSVDALALGVERVGEAQRFQTKILNEKAKADPARKDRS